MSLPGKTVLISVLTGLVALCAVLPFVRATAAPPAQAPKRILILYDEDKDSLPGLAGIDRGLRESFRSRLGAGVEVSSESLALSRSEQAGYESLVAELYRRKYASAPPDLIVAVLEPPLDFLLRHAGTLFPGTPIVFSGVDAAAIKDRVLPGNVTGVLSSRKFSPTLEVALRLQPQTRNVFVVAGSSPFDRYLEGLVRRDLKAFEGRVAITYLLGMPMEALLARLSRLPDRSVILYTTTFADGTGRRFIPHNVAASIAAAANAPVYVFLDQYIGLGVVGGNVYSVDAHSSHIVDLGSEILGGASVASLPIRPPAPQVNMFDARQLRRWNLPEEMLPPGSIVRYQDPSVWALYRWYIIATIAVVLVQVALIAGLLVARSRQRRAESEALRERDNLAHVLRVTTLGELTSSLAHEVSQPLAAILLNAEAVVQALWSAGVAAPADVREAVIDIKASAEHASLVLDRVRALFRKEHTEHVAVDIGSVIENVVRLLRAAMLIERIDIRIVFGKAVPAVFGDPVQLEQVLLNVVRNACDAIGATREGPRVITIETSQNVPGHVLVEVSDTGVGVARGELEHMFEHFVSTKPSGLGMGLAISRSIINAHGGRIWATTNRDRGLTVHIALVAYVNDALEPTVTL